LTKKRVGPHFGRFFPPTHLVTLARPPPQWRTLTGQENKFYRNQGDQIGRIFAHWVVVNDGNFFEYFNGSPKAWATFFNG
jgi:hypothetical protein